MKITIYFQNYEVKNVIILFLKCVCMYNQTWDIPFKIHFFIFPCRTYVIE